MTKFQTIWGIHMGAHVGSAPIDDGYIAIGWPELGDLGKLPPGRDGLKAAIIDKIPDTKAGAVPVHAGVLERFANEMAVGDLVVYPSKSDRLVNIGEVVGPYQYKEQDPDGYPNHHPVKWIATLSRNDFTQSALNEIGSALTLFKVKTHRLEFLKKAGLVTAGEVTPNDDENGEADDETATAAVSHQAEETTEDFIIRRLSSELNGYQFEYFVAHVLECMGYTARVSSKSGDGGVDVIAHRDVLGFEPPILKVQCKKMTGQTGEPDVNQLLGTIGEGEFALYVNLGSYSRAARLLERNRSKLRLIDGEQLVELVLLHYEQMSPRYRAIIPLKQIYVPDLGKPSE
jgi:restriction system protein